MIDFGDLPVFKGATTYPCILNINKTKPAAKFYFAEIPNLKFTNLKETVNDIKIEINKEKLESSGWKLVGTDESDLMNKISSAGIPLLEYVNGKIF